jgi:hypothetical protein
MIEIGIFILAGFIFYKYARQHNLMALLWAFFPITAYYTGLLGLLYAIKLFAPELRNERDLVMMIALFIGALFIGLAYLIMTRVAKSKAKKQSVIRSNLLDD